MSAVAQSWATADAVMDIEGMEPRRFKIAGVTPLLCNNPNSMLTLKTGSKPGERIPPPEVEAEAKVYRDEHGNYAFPSDAVRHCIVKAADIYRVGRKSLEQYIAHIIVVPQMIPILDPDTWQPVIGYALDQRRVVRQRQGVICTRPRFDRWAMEFTVLADPSIIPMPKATKSIDELLVALLVDAGRRMGLGDYRPARNGPFGRFKVVIGSPEES